MGVGEVGMIPFYDHNDVTVFCADALDLLATLDDGSVGLVTTDPPYRMKAVDWDRQWETTEDYLAWIGELCAEFCRVLQPNGSLYLFASPQMAARVEVKVEEYLNVLNHIVWVKHDGSGYGTGSHSKSNKDLLRSYFPQTERIIFAEHHNSDNAARGEAGYVQACDELRGFVFEPLRAYLAGEIRRAGQSTCTVGDCCGVTDRMIGHYMGRSQWALPTRERYEQMKEFLNQNGGEYLRREYEYLRREYEYLRREYEYLRREYEELRRPFNARPDAAYTDVWNFPTVQSYPGKHICEKPLPLMTHIVEMSSRPDTLVLDPFCGSGATLIAARNLGRRAIGGDVSRRWCRRTAQRLARTMEEWPASGGESGELAALPLFAAGEVVG